MNDPIDRVDRDGQWSLLKSITNIGSSIYDAGRNIVGNVVEAVVDVTREYVDAVIDLGKKIIDVGERFIEDVKDACDWVVSTVISTAMAVQKAWDSLDSGLKQWIITGVAFAVSFIPLVGPIISCIIDGTFVDMFNALMKGDWATVGMCALGFVPGMKALKGLKAVGGLNKAGKMSRYCSKTEAKMAELTKKIKSQNIEGTYATTKKTSNAAEAQRGLGLGAKPEARMDFDPINNPKVRTDVPAQAPGGWPQTLYDTRAPNAYIEVDPDTFRWVEL